MITIEEREYLTLAETAERLGTTLTHVLMLLRGKALEGRYMDHEWYVAGESAEVELNRERIRFPLKGCAGCSSTGGCGSHGTQVG